MVNLGDKVKDLVTGFTGIATCRHSYLNGCDRITIAPIAAEKNSILPEERSFDEPQLKVVKAKVVAQGDKRTGGPAKYNDTRKATGKR